MNTYYLKKFRKRFEIKTDGDEYVCFDKKEKRYLSGTYGNYSLAVIKGICSMLGLPKLTDYVIRHRNRELTKKYNKFTSLR